MSDRNELLLRRLQDGLATVESLKGSNIRNSDFVQWQRRVKQAFTDLLGAEHSCTSGFERLRFWLPRIQYGTSVWTREDAEVFERDLKRAADLIQDALEELEFAPPSPVLEQKKPGRGSPAAVIVNVTNVLSQATSISISQVNATLDSLDLTLAERTEAESLAADLQRQIDAARWPLLAATVDKMKGFGKGLYEKVAIPLLVEFLKRESGLTSGS